MEWIIKYKVQRVLQNSSITLLTSGSLERAKEVAKEQVVYRDKIAILKCRYASEQNLKKDMTFDSHYIWASYFHGWEEIDQIKD